jgi:hypothetical protein
MRDFSVDSILNALEREGFGEMIIKSVAYARLVNYFLSMTDAMLSRLKIVAFLSLELAYLLNRLMGT